MQGNPHVRLMRGMWKRSYGRATKAPPDERGGNRHARPTATAPHPNFTLSVARHSRREGQLRVKIDGPVNDRAQPVHLQQLNCLRTASTSGQCQKPDVRKAFCRPRRQRPAADGDNWRRWRARNPPGSWQWRPGGTRIKSSCNHRSAMRARGTRRAGSRQGVRAAHRRGNRPVRSDE